MTAKWTSRTFEGYPAWVGETEAMALTVVPKLGGKAISLVNKRTNREWLWRSGKPLGNGGYGTPFSAGDESGWDEMFPAINAGTYPDAPWQGTAIPDHGEVWALPWSDWQAGEELRLRVNGVKFPYTLSKTYSFPAEHTLRDPNLELARNRRNMLLITIGALVFVVAVIALFSLLAQQQITRPIQRLGQAMKAVRSGNFHVTLKPPKHRDDLSELTRNFNFMTDKIRELIETEYQMQLRNKEAQILALQMQINPHFLYNTLQTIGGKAVLAGDYEIHEMCRALGDMFRYSFYEGNLESTIGRELAHVNNYLYLQQLRFEDSLQTEFAVDAALMDCSVIRFVLQPVIENVVVHGLGKRKRRLKLKLSAFREGDDVVIELADDGPGIDPVRLASLRSELERRSYEVFAGVSIGLKNVHERIRLAYGPAYGLTVASAPDAGTKVGIRIPYKKRGTELV